LETLFCWTKFVDEGSLESWETRLLLDEVAHTASKQTGHKRWQLASYCATREEAETLKTRYGGGVNRLAPMDWVPSGAPGAAPLIRIRDAIVVTEARDESALAPVRERFPHRIVLSFPPQLAFGTGNHPTTAGCLRLLVDLTQRRGSAPATVLDLGCGSGILAIAAAKLGAERVLAVDLDGMALDFARRNAEYHGVADRIEFLETDLLETLATRIWGAFDLVMANLFSSLLVEALPSLPDRLVEGGDLVLSGLLTSQTREVSEAAERAGLPLDRFLRRGKWVAVAARKKKNA